MGKSILLMRFGLAAILAMCSGAAFSQGAQEEVDKQISKLIGDAISSRISSSIVSESGSAMPAERNNIWGSYSRIGVDFDVDKTRTNAYVFGYDRDVSNNLVLGLSLSATDTNLGDGKSTGISPYLAYKFTKSVFAIATYNYTSFDFDGGDGNSNSLGASLNVVQRSGDFLFKGRAQIAASESKVNFGGDTSRSSATSYLGDAEAGYFFAPGWYGYAGLQLGDSNRDNSYATYARLGIEKEFGKNSAVSLRYEAKVDDNVPGGTNFKVNIWTLAGRFRF